MWKSETLLGRILSGSLPWVCNLSSAPGIIREIQLLLREAANHYNLEPEEQLGAWLHALEPLIKAERGGLGRSRVVAPVSGHLVARRPLGHLDSSCWLALGGTPEVWLLVAHRWPPVL